jgi:lipoprotein-releasing system permease protein
VTAIIISFLATLYPSWQASRLMPAEALRYE